MFETIQVWWAQLKLWTAASTVGVRQETVESYLSTVAFRLVAEKWGAHLAANIRFPQILRDKTFPTDRPDQLDLGIRLPASLDYELHEWESTTEKGWTLLIYVDDQVLTITRRGKIGWTDIERDIV